MICSARKAFNRSWSYRKRWACAHTMTCQRSTHVESALFSCFRRTMGLYSQSKDLNNSKELESKEQAGKHASIVIEPRRRMDSRHFPSVFDTPFRDVYFRNNAAYQIDWAVKGYGSPRRWKTSLRFQSAVQHASFVPLLSYETILDAFHPLKTIFIP